MLPTAMLPVCHAAFLLLSDNRAYVTCMRVCVCEVQQKSSTSSWLVALFATGLPPPTRLPACCLPHLFSVACRHIVCFMSHTHIKAARCFICSLSLAFSLSLPLIAIYILLAGNCGFYFTAREREKEREHEVCTRNNSAA